MPKYKSLLAKIIVTVCSLLVLSSCGKNNSSQMPSMPPVEVGSVTLQTENVDLTVELPGRINAFNVAEIRPQVSGIIQKRMFEEGGFVKAGDQLYQIDPAVYKAAYDTATAQLARSKALISSSSSLEKRYKELLEINAVSKQEYVDASSSLAQANAEVAVAEAAKQTAQINLTYTKVLSPIDGRIGKSAVTVGALVTANQPEPIALVQQLDPVYVDVTQASAELLKLKQKIAEGKLASVNNETPVSLLLDDLGTKYELQGKLKFEDVTVEQQTGNVLLRAIFPNPDNKLMPGLFVRAIIKQGQINNAILVPQQAVTRNPEGGALAWIIDKDNKVQSVPVELGDAIKDKWLVLKGLEAGQKVIVEGLIKVRPGVVVKAVDILNAKDPVKVSLNEANLARTSRTGTILTEANVTKRNIDLKAVFKSFAEHNIRVI